MTRVGIRSTAHLHAESYADVLAGLPGVEWTAALTPVHGLLAAAFLAAYVALERGLYRHSERLYVVLLNAARPPTDTQLTAREEYDEY